MFSYCRFYARLRQGRVRIDFCGIRIVIFGNNFLCLGLGHESVESGSRVAREISSQFGSDYATSPSKFADTPAEAVRQGFMNIARSRCCENLSVSHKEISVSGWIEKACKMLNRVARLRSKMSAVFAPKAEKVLDLIRPSVNVAK
jgi:hypothetical protein